MMGFWSASTKAKTNKAFFRAHDGRNVTSWGLYLTAQAQPDFDN
jgi:hypothetical protein